MIIDMLLLLCDGKLFVLAYAGSVVLGMLLVNVVHVVCWYWCWYAKPSEHAERVKETEE